MITFPFCKINLGLHITSKRDDGYHNLQSVFIPVQWKDALEVVPSTDPGLQLTVHNADLGDSQDNILQKAYNTLGVTTGLSCNLVKQIPHGAGLGGGSSDAVHFLSLANEILKLGLGPKELGALALHIGSDCPFFLQQDPMYVEGRGEHLSEIELDLTGLHLLVVFPGTHISTAEAFAGITPNSERTELKGLIQQPISEWQSTVINDFEQGAIDRHPELGELKNSLIESGALYASMTGSGSTFFGLFDEDPDTARFPKNWQVHKELL